MVQIIDVSVAIKWFILEDRREEALSVLAEVLHRPFSFAVPELFYFELAHVFHRVIPRAEKSQLALLAKVMTLGIQRFSMTPELLAGIREFQAMGLSGYDAAYVALAKMLRGKWLTSDRKAHALAAPLGLSEEL